METKTNLKRQVSIERMNQLVFTICLEIKIIILGQMIQYFNKFLVRKGMGGIRYQSKSA